MVDGNTCFQLVCGGFFMVTSVISLVGTLVTSGACDDCYRALPIKEVKALLCPPRTVMME